MIVRDFISLSLHSVDCNRRFLLKKSTSFPDFISEKIIAIDKILAFLQAFEHAISMFTTAQGGIWVGLLVT